MMNSSSRLGDLGLLALRITTAGIFIPFGYMKLTAVQAVMSGTMDAMTLLTAFLFFAEIIGGLAVLVGFLTRWAALGLSIIMVGAIGFLLSGQFGAQAAQFVGGWSFPLAILGGTLALAGLGGGCLAVDCTVCRQKMGMGGAKPVL